MRTEDEWVNSPRKSSHATRVAVADHSISEKAAKFVEKFPPLQMDLEGATFPDSHSPQNIIGKVAELDNWRKKDFS